MSKRVSPAQRLRAQIDGVFSGGQDLARALEEVAQLGAQLLLQCAVEAEVAAFLGRERYARLAGTEDARQGMRYGYCPTTVKTTAGPITLQRPKLRNTTERFASQLFGKGVTKTNALEALVIAGFVRGLSTRDVEAALTEALGESATVSRSTVSRICTEIKVQFEAWSARRLDDVELDYLFLDGSHFKYHANAAAEPVLAAWGIDTDGKPVFVGLDAASSESGDAWEGFLTGLGERGLRCPLLVISDGAAGLIGALERDHGRGAAATVSGASRPDNVLAKVPKNAQAQVKADYWAIFDVPDTIEPGLHAVGYVQKRIDSFDKRWRDAYPAAVGAAGLTGRALDEIAVPHPGPVLGESRCQGHRSAARRALLPQAGVGGARPRLGRLARIHHDTGRAAAAGRPAPFAARPACPTAATEFGSSHRNRRGVNRFRRYRIE